MDIRDEIRARLPIDHVVARYCQLTKKGRNFVCLCPFHNDKHPSFLVSPDKGIAYCFACQTGGDIFSFVQKIENVDFPTALRTLADQAGVVLPKESSPAIKTSRDANERARECLECATQFYISKLKATPLAQEYLQKRGVTPELEAVFQIGFAPDSFSETYDHLLKAGFGKSEILNAGLGVQKDLQEGRIYDRFRNRIMFPIFDAMGKMIGFGGRTLGDQDAKYINSPEGPLYHKSNVLFGLSLAKEAIRQTKKVMLVEGYFDVVAAHKAGVKNVVAVSGTALTPEHVRTLKRYAETVMLCLDQDIAGQTAADKAFQLLAPQGVRIESIVIPAKDPDEFVQQDAAAFKALAENSAQPYLDAVLTRLSSMQDATSPQGKRRITEKLFPLLQSLPSSVELREYVRKIAVALQTVESDVTADFSGFRTQHHIPGPKQEVEIVDNTPFSAHALVLGLAILYPAQRSVLAEVIPDDDKNWGALRQAILEGDAQASANDILVSLQAETEFTQQVQVLLLFCEENFARWSESIAARELKKLCTRANKDLMVKKQMEIIEQIKLARKAGSIDDEAMLLTKYQQILKLAKMAG